MAIQLLRHRFSVEEYHRMGQAGIFSEDARVELIEGEILEMTPIGSRHAAQVARLTDVLTFLLQRHAIVWVQNPVQLGSTIEPQPDLCVLRRRPDFYANAHPGPDDILLVIEVADTSLEFDRTVKIPLYARTGIHEAWLVDTSGSIEVHRGPTQEGYRDMQRAAHGQRLTVEAFPDLSFPVDELLL